jgi:predicted porin
MKRAMLLILILALTLGLSSLAFAGEDNTTVYGKIHMSQSQLDDGTDTEVDFGSNSSRLGFKGWTEVNEYLTAIWQVESAIAWDEGDGTWAARNSYLGFKSEYGKLIAGRHDTPFKTVGRKFDFFGDRLGDSRNATSYLNTYGLAVRESNIVMYTTPAYEGVTVNAMSNEDNSLLSFSAYYKRDECKLGGHMMLGAAVEMHDETISGGAETETAFRGGFLWSNCKVKVSGQLLMVSNTSGVDGVSAMAYGGGACYTFRPGWKVKGQYFMMDCNTDMDDDAGTLMTFGLDYVPVKDTTFYAVYSMTTNEDNGMWENGRGGFGRKVTPLVAGDNVAGFGIGMIQCF